VAPFAIATKLGWFKELGLEVEIVNLPGSSDCVRNLATGEVLVAVPTVEPVVAILGLTGVKTQVFYTVFRRNIGALLANSDMPSFATSQVLLMTWAVSHRCRSRIDHDAFGGIIYRSSAGIIECCNSEHSPDVNSTPLASRGEGS
jgi:hypothetical protein